MLIPLVDSHGLPLKTLIAIRGESFPAAMEDMAASSIFWEAAAISNKKEYEGHKHTCSSARNNLYWGTFHQQAPFQEDTKL